MSSLSVQLVQSVLLARSHHDRSLVVFLKMEHEDYIHHSAFAIKFLRIITKNHIHCTIGLHQEAWVWIRVGGASLALLLRKRSGGEFTLRITKRRSS